jgi:hypothetical protein
VIPRKEAPAGGKAGEGHDQGALVRDRLAPLSDGQKRRWARMSLEALTALPDRTVKQFGVAYALGRLIPPDGDEARRLRDGEVPIGSVVSASLRPKVLGALGIKTPRGWEKLVTTWIRCAMAHRCRPGEVTLFDAPSGQCPRLRCERSVRPDANAQFAESERSVRDFVPNSETAYGVKKRVIEPSVLEVLSSSKPLDSENGARPRNRMCGYCEVRPAVDDGIGWFACHECRAKGVREPAHAS